MPRYILGNGTLIDTGAVIGKGGEGTVYEVPGNTQVVAKLYHHQIDSTKAQKLATMVSLQSDRLHNLAAWPISTLHNSRGEPPVGLLMRRISGFKEAHQLYSPTSRKSEFPSADWRFLIHVSGNLARAVAVVHEHGHVVGDINHGNFLINAEGLAALIDCDSFQINAQNLLFPCNVGVPTYTPPELQNRSFSGAHRTPNHDNFGLAILIFHLLFMGRHPYAGRFDGSGDMPIEKAIAEHRFAFGRDAAKYKMRQPPHTLALGAVSDAVGILFERAFGPHGNSSHPRPTAIEWIGALDTLGRQLKNCSLNHAHHFYRQVPSCPWCDIEKKTGVTLFAPHYPAYTNSGGVNIELLWKEIQSVPTPGSLPTLQLPVAGASDFARRYGQKRQALQTGGVAATVLFLVFLFAGGGASAAIALAVVCGGIAIGAFLSVPSDAKDSTAQRLKQAAERLESLDNRWRTECSEQSFVQLLQALESRYREYVNLPSLRRQKYEALLANVRQAQLHTFLESHFIENGTIRGIGPSRKAVLASFGIETAADISESALSCVPGVGSTSIATLLIWRRTIEGLFVFDSSAGVQLSAINALDLALSSRRTELENEIASGRKRLEAASEFISKSRARLAPEYAEALKERAQLEADLGAMQ